MKTTLLIVGMTAMLGIGATTAQAQSTPAAPPTPRGDHDARGAPGSPGGFGGPGQWGRGDHGPRGGRGRGGPPPTQAEIEKRNAEFFAKLDVNRDGKATAAEFQGFMERQRAERELAMFKRFSNGKDSVTLSELNARAAERAKARETLRGYRPPR